MHSLFSDGELLPSELARRALVLGHEAIAITDHGPFPKPLQKKINSRRMSIEQYEEVYLDMLERSVSKHKDEILVLKGYKFSYYLPKYILVGPDIDIIVPIPHVTGENLLF